MGFVCAAQMAYFPVGVGITGNLAGGALLAFTLGPVTASVVMTATVTHSGPRFQDGGILALGPNILNTTVLGVPAGYLPFHLWVRENGGECLSSPAACFRSL